MNRNSPGIESSRHFGLVVQYRLDELYLVPEVEAAGDGDHGEEDAGHDEEADLDVGEEEEREEEDADEAEPHVAPELLPDDPVRLPRDVDGAVGERVRREAGALDRQCG